MGPRCETKKQQGKSRRWFQKYLPFIARSPEMQVGWLVAEFEKKKLGRDDLTPYIRLLFSADNVGREDALPAILAEISPGMLMQFLQAADIYDVPRLITLIPDLDADLVEIALLKELPPYETKPQKVMDKVLNAVNDRSEEILCTVAERIMANGSAPEHFAGNYHRFRAILDDKGFIRSQWPNAR